MQDASSIQAAGGLHGGLAVLDDESEDVVTDGQV